MIQSKILKRQDLEDSMNLDDQVKSDDHEERAPVIATKGRVISQEVYQASDAGRKIIEEAQEEARQIKKKAEEILKRVHDERTRVLKEGYEEGKNQALAEVTELLATATYQKEEMFKNVEHDAVKLVYEVAEKVLGAELKERDGAIVDLVKQALHSAVGQRIIVLVNPQDLESVKVRHADLMQALDASRVLQIRMDERVKPSGCMIETEIGTIDAQLETQLLAIRRALGLES